MASTYTPINTTTLGSTASSITFSSIPATYTDLVIVINARSNGTGGGTDGLELRFNSDSGSNYSYTQLYGNGSSAVSTRSTNTTSAAIGNIPVSDNGSSSYFDVCTGQIMNYSNSTTYKTVLGRSGPASSYVIARVGLWRNTAAITSVTAVLNGGNSFLTGTIASIYGIKAA